MLDLEGCEVASDLVHHHGDGLVAHDRQPRTFIHRLELVAILFCQRLAHRLQIIAGIKPFRDGADVLAERLAVAQERRARQHVDLSAGVVDVIFTGNIEPCELQQTAQGITEHSAAAMADMHRTGRIG